MPTNRDGAGRRAIEWTGERCVPWADDLQVVYEHYHRYLFAASQVAGRRVLDLASGEGYGSAVLATQAREVVGLEIDGASVSHSSDAYQLPNLSFVEGDMLDLSAFAPGSFDVVVCFEAIEHVSDHGRLVDGVSRVLAPDGLFIASTPDRDVSASLDEDNPFHVRELNADEFEGFLRNRFDHVQLWGQNSAVGSVLAPLEPAGQPGDLMTLALQPDEDHWVAGTKLVPRYLVAVASRRDLEGLPGYSTLVDVGLELVRRTARQRDEAVTSAALHAAERDDFARGYEQALQSVRRSRRSELRAVRRQEALGTAVAGAREALRESEQRQDALYREIEDLTASAWFRVASRYRGAIERVLPGHSVRRRGYGYVVRSLAGAPATRPQAAVPASSLKRVPASLPTSEDPELTIVIPVHNQWPLTANCLASIAEDVPATAYSVVVVDDASTDDTTQMLQHVRGITVVRLQPNGGFVNAVNAGVDAAKGQFVVLLNNDTTVRPGWLDALFDIADTNEDVGIVGSKLLYPDGRLQEAGGVVARDGSAWNCGRGGDANDPAYNFRRDVDYCSGASLLVRRDLWDALGGLDTRFAPAYYEDTDLAFSARKLGYRVVYEPRSVVVHHEGGSNGTDLSSGVKRHQVVNQETFRSKWQHELATQLPSQASPTRLASWRPRLGRVLVIDEHVPTPNQDSGSRRMWELLCILNDLGFGVTFLPNSGVDLPSYSGRLRDLGIEVLDGCHRIRGYLKEVSSDLQVAILCRPEPTWQHLPLLRTLSPQTKIIYDTVDLHFVRERRRAEIEGDPERFRIAEQQREMELSLAKAADATLVVSPVERELLLEELPDLSVHVVPNIHRDEAAGQPFGRRQGLLFVGSFPHDPNRDAAHWLVEEILPLVHETLPDVPTYIVGSHPTDDIWALAGHGVRVLGWVPDLGDLYERARLFVAPLRYGAGMKGKVGESLAHGLPVVTTRIGAEGMGLVDETDVLVADGAADFAAAVVRAYRDEELWTTLAVNGRRTISRRYSPDAVRPLLSEVLAGLRIPIE
ncbi:MAG: glycosyltransferase [Acidimicrobiales bacterium]|jgi:GT2 family glycosyltransferase/SAM-dependent methyltransferase